MRLLFSRLGTPHCRNAGARSAADVEQIVDKVHELPEGARIMLMAPLIRGPQGEHERVFEDARRAGYVRVRVDGEIRDLGEEIELDKNKKHTIEVVVDRLIVRTPGRTAAGRTTGSPTRSRPRSSSAAAWS